MKYLILMIIAFTEFSCKNSKTTDPTVPIDNKPVELKSTVIVSGLVLPWEIIYGPDDQLWITEKSGKISRVNPLTKQISPLFTITDVVRQGEGGLLGKVLHPEFSTSPYVYVVYNYNSSSGYREKVVRYNYSNNTLTNPNILLQNIPAGTYHNGSRLLISNDKKLFVTTGDATNSESAQQINSLSGKVLRLNLDGSIPSDNPITGSYVYSFGHRNAQGLVMVDEKIFSSEHGPNSDDEINLIQKGRNYGWPNVEGFCNTSAESSFCANNNVVEPLINWTPTVATAGLTYYNKELIPQWKNSLLLTTLKASKIIQLKLNENKTIIESQQDFFANEYGRKRAICIGKEGEVYFITSNGSDDKIVMVRPLN